MVATSQSLALFRISIDLLTFPKFVPDLQAQISRDPTVGFL